MDCRHVDPIVSLTLHFDAANPLLYWFLSAVAVLIAGVLLAFL